MITFRGIFLVFVPVALGVVGPVMLATCYTIAVLKGHVSKLFPYISDTGGDAPESCIFGQFLNIISLLLFIGMILRYKQVDCMVISLGLHRMNGLTAMVGALSALGGSLVANFQDTSVVQVHYVGAMFLFLFGIIYCFAQTYISYQINFHLNRSLMCHLRLILSVLAAICLITSLISGSVSVDGWNNHHVSKSFYKWGPMDGGYDAHLVSTFSEWGMSISLMGYFVTFIPDFLNMNLIMEMHFIQ